MTEEIIKSKYKLLKKIGEGGYGEVYKSIDLTSKQKYAIKIDRKRKGHVLSEGRILSYLQGTEGVPKLYEFGLTEKFSYLVMELLGPSLPNFIKNSKKPITQDQAASIGLQALRILENVHSKGYIHRDVKPHQFVLSKNKKSLYLVDYGLSTSYIYSNTHVPFQEDCVKIGSLAYASINTHRGYRQSRRDDLESLVFTLIFLVKRALPWFRQTSTNCWTGVYFIKKNISFSRLFTGCPPEFQVILTYIRDLRFEETPNYEYLKTVLRSIASNRHFKHVFSEKKKKKFRPEDAVILKHTLLIKNPFRSFSTQDTTMVHDLPAIKDRSILNFKNQRLEHL